MCTSWCRKLWKFSSMTSLSMTPAVGLSLAVFFCRLCQWHRPWVCHWQCYLSFLSMTSAVGLSLAVLFVVFVNDIGRGFVIGSVICRLCQRHRRWVCHWQCYLSSLSTTPAVVLSLTVLFVVFVNDTRGGFVIGSVIMSPFHWHRRWVCHWQCYLSSLSTTPAVTDSIICRLCQRHRRWVCHWQCFGSGFTKSEVRSGSRLLMVQN